MTSTDHTDRPVDRSTRRFGPRSLSGRLVLLLMLPMLVAQFLLIRELERRRTSETDANALVERIGLTTTAETVYAPAAFEEMTSLGLSTVDELGIQRTLLTTVIGLDYQPYLTRARTQLDAALDALARDYGDQTLADGRTINARLAPLRVELQRQRDLLDQRVAEAPQIARALASVIGLVDDVGDLIKRDLYSVHDVGVVGAAEEASQLLTMIRAVTAETRSNAAGLGAFNGVVPASDVLAAGGVAEFSIQQYFQLIADEPEAATTWLMFVNAPASVDYLALRPTIANALTRRLQLEVDSSTDQSNALITDPAFIRDLSAILQASFDRLEAFAGYGQQRFDQLTERAAEIGSQARHDVRSWVVLSIGSTLVIMLFLAFTLWSTVRPLARLTARALEVGGGEIPAGPLHVSGPSDVRAVTTTFNSMLATLGSFDRQLTRLATGDDIVADEVTNVPGALGETLRGSVRHLADVTTRLRESEALATAIIETANDAIWTLGRGGNVLSTNSAGERLLGIPVAWQVGQQLTDLFGGRPLVSDLSGEIDFRRADGSVGHALLSQSSVWVDDRSIRAVFARDVSDRKQFEQRLSYQARHDALTDLPNRLAAIEHLDSVLAHCEQTGCTVGVLFIDLDGFKAVNDTRGHASGDILLREIARRLRHALDDTEFVGRLGGDEFLVITQSLDIAELTRQGTRLIEAVAQPVSTDDDTFIISATIGAVTSTGGVGGLELVRRADVAVYHAKSQGRGRVVVFDEALRDEVEAKAEIELALRRAVVDGQLELFFQPIIDTTMNQPWGAEALLRWNRPGFGQVLPDRFIPVAERSTLIIDLERWVLDRGLRTLAGWQRDPRRRHLRLAINVSGRHLMEGDLIADLRVALDETGADPTGLEIELTETHLLADLERANAALRVIRSWGVDIAVDDFGTGYSSMSYLRHLEVDTIKIDQVFVARAHQGGYDRTIVEVLLQLATALDLDVVAEGVETAEQLQFLLDRNCRRVQGFHLAPPLPLDEAHRWLDQWKPESALTALAAFR